jgi:predicted O-methyltransferase YrrM
VSRRTLFLDERLYDYLMETSVKQLPVQRSLAEATAGQKWAGVESSPEQVQLLQLLVRLIDARRCLEVGVFTGCSTLGIALALPPDGLIVACDIDESVTALAREYWQRAGVASKIDLRLAPAIETLDSLLAKGRAETFDFAYIDADKGNADGYYERVLRLLRPNGLMATDNVFWRGRVADPQASDCDTVAIQALNAKMCRDPRVEVCMIPIGDGLSLARKRARSSDVSRTAGANRPPIEIAIAEPELCAAACREIYAQRPRWRGHRMNGKPPFYTLGEASYLALGFEGRSVEDYLRDAGSLWEWAGDAVQTLFERVRRALAHQLDQPVEYPDTVPSPGFHIFIGAAIPREDCASCHFDGQHRFIPWDRWYESVDLDHTISFTLPLKLPASGGGLTVWESLTLERVRDDIVHERIADIPSAAHVTPSTTIAYSVGRMVLHGGHLLHQIAGVPRVSVTDERITLQGHGVFADGSWRLYW